MPCCPCFAGVGGGDGDGVRKKSSGAPPISKLIKNKDVANMEAWAKPYAERADLKPLLDSLRLAVTAGDPNVRTPEGETCLHVAVRLQQNPVVSELLKARASTDATNSDGKTPVDLAKGAAATLRILEREFSRVKTEAFMEDISFVQHVALFASLDASDYPRLAEAFIARSYEAGQNVIRQGDSGTDFFIIQSGSVSVKVRPSPDEEEEQIATLGQDDYFGEMALLSDEPRKASVEAASHLQVRVLSRAAFEELHLKHKLFFKKRNAVRGGGEGAEEQVVVDQALLEKSVVDKRMIQEAMLSNDKLSPLFEGMSGPDLGKIVDSAYREEVAAGAEVIREGDIKAFLFYVVAEGTLDFEVHGKRVGQVSAGGSFGELALLYKAPRAATVRAATGAKLWVISRVSLKNVLEAPTRIRLDQYADILQQIDNLARKSFDVRLQLADAMTQMTFFAGEYVLRQKDTMTCLFVLYNGEVAIEEDGKEKKRVSAIAGEGKSEFFWEEAILQDEDCPASVRCTSEKVTILSLDRTLWEQIVSDPSVKSIAVGTSQSFRKKPGVRKEYKMEELQELGVLGCGGFGVVTLVKDRTSKTTFALKALSKGYIIQEKSQKSILNEKSILRMTHSPFLVRLAATFNSQEHLFFVLEPALGGELFTVYQRHNFYGSQPHGQYYVACVARALEHMHARRIIYRDLKPENLLLDSQGLCKVTDFGLALFVIGHAYTTCGTPDYFAPEMVSGLGYTCAVDWWALGVLTFELMTGQSPFTAGDPIRICTKVKAGIERVLFPPSAGRWGDLVKQLCKQEPSERLPCRQRGVKNIEEHQWYSSAKFDWATLDNHQMVAPYVPEVRGVEDMRNFDTMAEEDHPPHIPYVDPEDGWDSNFEERWGPADFID